MAEYNLQDIQALIGQMIYDAFQKNLMEFTQFGGSVYSDIGMYPKDYIDNLGSGTPMVAIPLSADMNLTKPCWLQRPKLRLLTN